MNKFYINSYYKNFIECDDGQICINNKDSIFFFRNYFISRFCSNNIENSSLYSNVPIDKYFSFNKFFNYISYNKKFAFLRKKIEFFKSEYNYKGFKRKRSSFFKLVRSVLTYSTPDYLNNKIRQSLIDSFFNLITNYITPYVIKSTFKN